MGAGLESGSGIAPLEIPFGVCRDLLGGEDTLARRLAGIRSPSGGASPGAVLPRMAPLILGLPGFAGIFLDLLGFA